MVTRVASFGIINALNKNNLELQAKYSLTQIQISSGLKSNDFKGIAFRSEELLNLEADAGRIDGYLRNVTIAENRTNYQDSILTTLIDRLTSFRTDIAASLGTPPDPGTDAAFLAAAQQDYADFVTNLNSQQGSDYIFSGTTTNVRPVDITDPGFTPLVTPPSAANTTYYQGDASGAAINIPIGDSFNVDVAIQADSSGFEKALRAFRLIVDNPGDNVAREEAFALVTEATGELSAIQAGVRAVAGTLESQKLVLSQEAAFIEEIIFDIKGVDIAEASLRSQQIQSQLEASYATSVRFLNLSLLDFVR